MLERFKNKRILILGWAKEGKDTFLFLRKLFPNKVLGVADRNERVKKIASSAIRQRGGIRWHLGQDYLKTLKDYDMIVKSPGVPIHLPEIESAYKAGKITSQTAIFFENCPGKIIGVTGTKGKSTTAALIYKILKDGSASSPQGGGIKAHLVGNIGKPVLSLLLHADLRDVYVYELSCHQLYCLKKSPQIAVFLNIYPEHLDYYKDFKEYIRAKANITRYQTKDDYLIFNSSDKIVKEIAEKSKAKKIPVSPTNYEFKRITNKIGKIPLVGKFNLFNLAVAVEVGKLFKIPDKIIAKAIKNFKPLPYRLKYLGTFRGIKFYDDSLSTIPETAIAALDALGKNVETMILGGYERNLDFTKLAKRILKSEIKNIILFPATGKRIWQSIRQAQDKTLRKKHLVVSRIEPFFVFNMAEAVKISYQQTKRGKICLLSTASPSFGIFRDYKEKGNLFKKYIKKTVEK